MMMVGGNARCTIGRVREKFKAEGGSLIYL